MKNKTYYLREAAKFLSGLIVADILVGIWVGFGTGQGFQSIFFGIPFTTTSIGLWIVFDLVLLVLLVHFAWHVSIPLSHSKKALFAIVGVLLGLVAILHLARVLFGAALVIGGWSVPIWLSIVGAAVTGFLSYASLHFAAQ